MQQTQHADWVLKGAHIATLDPAMNGYGIIEEGALVIANDHILWLGPLAELPPHFTAKQTLDCHGKWLLPGLVDCHTHLVFAGDRADEFEQRLSGVSYAEIARRGGGIRRTMTATREATEDCLLALATKRALTLLRQGVTCIEVKSGYGLNTETELKLLRVARRLGKDLPITVRTTFLGAHALPPEFEGNAEGYIDLVCDEMLPLAHAQGLVDAVDVFCEGIGFNLAQTRRVFEAAKSLGLPVKLHAEQLSNLGGSELAAEFAALSVDHIEFLDEAGVKAIAASDTVATLLPGAFYFLKETQKPPIALLRKHKVPMALATDYNPGSSPLCHLPLMLNMGCTLFALTPLEALQGVTIHAAKALGLSDRLGSLKVGKQADLLLMDIGHPNQLAYEFGINAVAGIWQAGQPVSFNK